MSMGAVKEYTEKLEKLEKLQEIRRCNERVNYHRLAISAVLSVASLVIFSMSLIAIKYQMLLLNILSVILALISFSLVPKIKILPTKYAGIGLIPSIIVFIIWIYNKGIDYWMLLSDEFKLQPTFEGGAFSVTSLLLFAIYTATFPRISQAFAVYIFEKEWRDLWNQVWFSRLRWEVEEK